MRHIITVEVFRVFPSKLSDGAVPTVASQRIIRSRERKRKTKHFPSRNTSLKYTKNRKIFSLLVSESRRHGNFLFFLSPRSFTARAEANSRESAQVHPRRCENTIRHRTRYAIQAASVGRKNFSTPTNTRQRLVFVSLCSPRKINVFELCCTLKFSSHSLPDFDMLP